MLQSRSKKHIEQIPTFELAVMHVLWDRGASTVRQVMQDLPGDPAYTTVQTILNIMTRKGRTKRVLAGRTYVYRANIEREIVQKAELARVLKRMFRGSVPDLLRALPSAKALDPEVHECIMKSLELLP
jgi:BlaI family transcriptional regulator, penicillinase repressor